MRKKIIAGNWKMNKSFQEGLDLSSEIINMVRDEVHTATQVVLCPPFTHLNAVAGLIGNAVNMSTGAQNCYTETSGAYTGEVSAAILKSVGCSYIIVGHSERRQYFAEKNATLAKKTDAVLANGMNPIYCCGETLDERNSEKHFEVIKSQVSEGLFHLSGEAFGNVVIAYEPVWAIGTGVTASTAQAQEVHAFIRGLVSEKYGIEVANNLTIQYGGSVKPDNAVELFSQPDIDGGLIGGAALQSRSFVDIVKAMN
ncbi:MAG: triose-phosphate isomerase [Flavobacteriaceae bacterium]|nr:triose-phosphate isomerase [Flavobacteriaceae bacterium]